MEENLIKITDKDLIVFLINYGLEIQDIKKSGNKSLVFFRNTEKLKKATLEYANRTFKVNVADYIAAEKRIRTLLYLQKQ
ncbi:hypothetical protein VT91_09760 [Clostridium sporogenes]|uniref:DUF5659 domain-containing protein n=1 Tax=Clostridium botulinum TaxID=1491 RepID=UPI0007175867|nr:DUF5659 domain-containing protein [Clostridium botulinum]KRU29362.1 hypothetical protein WG71_16050 [Clostridium sporogenes]KRU33450.1 hypothetical protein VT91_09760 [Clostridium sporogenes]KRU33918.1 hypothetical protein VT28_04740 [Clostridium sporogenes]KRU43434.1 hypothetical protein VT95_16990 [Clostridium sporogenes]MBZ1330979.1 hypothetical protein [Clostridium botulinum]